MISVFDKSALQQYMLDNKIPLFRAKQIWNWVCKYGKTSFSEMPNIGLKLHDIFQKNIEICTPSVVNILKSIDGTTKVLLQLEDKNTIETVLIPSKTHNTICISSQVGCTVGCKFCNTGFNGFVRNLTTNEIVAQYVAMKKITNSAISNIVFMGMGEPLFNIDNVLQAINIFTDEDLFGISRRKITLSTSGIVPVLEKIVDKLNVKLAISLHAPNDQIREKIMPINKLYNLEKLFDVCQKYNKYHSFLRITFEYIMLNNVNDTDECAIELAKICKKLNAKVNIIRFNTWQGACFTESPISRVKHFATILKQNGIDAPIRSKHGIDIMAACGQLSSSNNYQVSSKTD